MMPRLHADAATRVLVLTGAGVSAESGIPTFRGAGGLWEGQRVEDVASPEGFREDPLKVWRFYSERRAQAAA
jgi:NAD-dependent deacetylase